jgi:2'-5' RNA ligase
MRTFIAIELPREIKSFLAELQNKLKESGADVKWVEPQNIHLTLKFLGEIDEKKLNAVTGITENVTKDKKAFPIRLSSMGAFPNIDYPRIIWIGIDKGDIEAKQIAEELEDNLTKIGIPKEDRPFSSHITIGRTRSTQNRNKLVWEIKNLMNISGQKNLEFAVTKITLFESNLTPKGPIYKTLKEASLKTT